jgi:hypothetical protein
MIVPTLSDGTPYYSQRTNLDGVDYQLDFQWSTRESRWYLSLRDTSGDLLAGPAKINTNWLIFHRRYRRPGMPTGEIWCLSLGSSTDPPGLDELGAGRRCELTYYPEGT